MDEDFHFVFALNFRNFIIWSWNYTHSPPRQPHCVSKFEKTMKSTDTPHHWMLLAASIIHTWIHKTKFSENFETYYQNVYTLTKYLPPIIASGMPPGWNTKLILFISPQATARMILMLPKSASFLGLSIASKTLN